MGVQEAVLGALVERSDYGYSLIKRLEEQWSSAAVYKALDRLRDRGLIEPAGDEDHGGRPRKRYRATSEGVSLDAARLKRDAPGFDGGLLERLNDAADVGAFIDMFEQEVLARIGSEPVYASDLTSKLVAVQRELFNEASLRWIQVARRMIDGSPDA